MRRLRWLLPIAILVILGAVGKMYLKHLRDLQKNAQKPPALLDPSTQGQAVDWCYEQSLVANPRVSICASKMTTTGGTTELEGLKLKLFHEGAKEYDLVTSERAEFNQTERKLYSDGDVEITLAVPVGKDGETPPLQPGRLLKIHSSGVEFSADSGAAGTSRPVQFEFDRGSGSSVGAHYDPTARQLRMDTNVKLDWNGGSADVEPMHIEAGQAWYFEKDSKVVFYPWVKMTRGTLNMEAANTEVALKEGAIEHVDAAQGHGRQESSGRVVEFGGKELHLYFDEHMTVKFARAGPEGRLVSTASAARTTVTGDQIDVNFAALNKESVLSNATTTGKSTVTSEPVPHAGVMPSETRVMKSDVIHLTMRTGGEEIDHVETDGAGTLDFLPNRPEQLKRNLTGDRIWVYYGPANRIDHFRSINVKTRTETKPPRLTESKEMLAYFDNTGSLARMEQNTDFRYEEGERRATSRRATMDQTKDMMTLDGAASTSDDTGKINADRIQMQQKSGDVTAEGNVTTTRKPMHKGNSSAMLSNDEIMQAQAKKMTATNHNQHIRYEGDAHALQGANRVDAAILDIDQQRHIMEAHGKVVTEIADREPPPDKAKATAPAFTVVHAQDLEYDTEMRIAHYTGGVHMDRPDLTVDGRELRAFLNNSSNETSLDKAITDGSVKIVSVRPSGRATRTRTGTSEHAEYYASDQKLILNGGRPTLVDSEAATTTGDELTWWANNDRLLVNGQESQPTVTKVPKTRSKK